MEANIHFSSNLIQREQPLPLEVLEKELPGFGEIMRVLSFEKTPRRFFLERRRVDAE